MAQIDADARAMVVVADDVNFEEAMGLWSKKGRYKGRWQVLEGSREAIRKKAD